MSVLRAAFPRTKAPAGGFAAALHAFGFVSWPGRACCGFAMLCQVQVKRIPLQELPPLPEAGQQSSARIGSSVLAAQAPLEINAPLPLSEIGRQQSFRVEPE